MITNGVNLFLASVLVSGGLLAGYGLEPAELNNTYALAVRASSVPQLDGITKLPQIKDLLVSERTFCVEAEFNSRPDGFKPVPDEYNPTLGGADGVKPDSGGTKQNLEKVPRAGTDFRPDFIEANKRATAEAQLSS